MNIVSLVDEADIAGVPPTQTMVPIVKQVSRPFFATSPSFRSAIRKKRAFPGVVAQRSLVRVRLPQALII